MARRASLATAPSTVSRSPSSLWPLRWARVCAKPAWVSCGKHYPGHGYVIPDSHVELPVDDRAFEAMQEDIRPYRELPLDGVMAAHVIYDCMDCNTAVFSNKWIRLFEKRH
jgi:hypothetical protein